MIELNVVELKYLEFKTGLITIFDFENWVYENEELIIKATSESMYEDLIILNYNTRDSKSMLNKILAFDLKRLELYQLQRILIHLINLDELRLENVLLRDDYYDVQDPYCRSSVYFNIGGIGFWLNNPFDFDKEYSKLTQERRKEILAKKLGNINFFEKIILENLMTAEVRLVFRNDEGGFGNGGTISFYGTKDDLMINIQRHRILVNKEWLLEKMKEY